MSIWDEDKRTFTKPNQLHNEEAMESMFEGTSLTELDLYQGPQATMKNKMGNFGQVDFQRALARAQVKYDETLTIASKSLHI